MKRYKIEYWFSSRHMNLIQLSKTGREDGVRIWFWDDGRGVKSWQEKCKNHWLNGIQKQWCFNLENGAFKNWKKGNEQGIQIGFR